MNPSISVLLPVHNAEAFLGEAIDSILGQTFTDFELLVINDGSTDKSRMIIESYSDPRIRLVNNETNLRLIATLNKGISLARGKYIARMDADDCSLPKRLEKQYLFMEKHADVGICGTGFETFGREQKVVIYPERDEDIRIMLLYQTALCHPTVMMRKEVLTSNNLLFDPSYIHAEDYELWARAADFTKFANIQEVLLKYRIHEDSISRQYKDIQHKNTITIIMVYIQKAGTSIDENEVELLRDIAYSKFSVEKDVIEGYENVLIKLIEANRQTNYFPHKQLELFVSDKWSNICLNASSLGWWLIRKCRQSKLSSLRVRIPLFKLKLFIKCSFGLQR